MSSSTVQEKTRATATVSQNGTASSAKPGFASGFVLEFEKPIVELEHKIAEMRALAESSGMGNLSVEIDRMQKKAVRMREEVFSKLSRWQKVQLARHPRRPYTLDYVERLCSEFLELHGDRCFADDRALVSGIGEMDGQSILIMGHQKGRGTKENIYRNFGMANPEGYRKAIRHLALAQKFKLPVVTFIDTPGAYPGLGAEERGQAEAIARSLYEMARLNVPIITFVIGEGGSGGALAISVADRIFMLEYSIYSVISPEGCASILYRDAAQAPLAAEALKLTAEDLLELGIIDGIIPEPAGGAHENYDEIAARVKERILTTLPELLETSPDKLLEARHKKYERIGFYLES
ncbi:MAG: acetyl-CoA carboxylase carboxyltransferase subunit alpha [Calditrichaeota bacterium]|nr:acetyl-CoA carboxylase carboxyltransferase subunit alpha [Calditrichota bacterium]MCB9368400.1 acetyl-CoA carboxylase carboxyltransferase subunit alpha [Calditrichota bacterium]